MNEFNQVSHVKIYDFLRAVKVSVIGEIIVALCMLSPVVQYNLVLTSVKNSSFWDISPVVKKGYEILYHATTSFSWGQLLYTVDKETLMPC